jgi:hypothetical protein
MALPGVSVNVVDGSLGLQPGSNQGVMLYLGCSLSGTANTLYSFGDSTTAGNTLVGGELNEAIAYSLKVAPGIVMAMPMPPTTRGGVGSVTHVGTGAGTVTVTIAPQSAITIQCTTPGTLGTAAFTFQIGSGAASAPVTSASGWSSTGYQVPGTYTTVVFTAGSYIAGGTPDTYVISTLGAVTHPTGAGPAVPTFTASPVDTYNAVVITIGTAGAVGTATFTYALDGVNTSAGIVTSATYAIPGTGLVLAFSGTFVANDTYSFQSAGPTFASGDLTTAITALSGSLLNQATYSQVCVLGTLAAAAAWSTQVATLESAVATLASNGVFVNFFSGGPTLGTVLPNAGSITVDAADTDSVVITQRQGMSANDVVPCAGDWLMTSAVSGVQFRRNASWAAAARAAKVAASQDIGAASDGGITSAVKLYRDENATPGFFNAGITCLRTFSGLGLGGVYVTRGLTGALSTSDYYPLTNTRVIKQAQAITRLNLLPYINTKIPTQTRNGQIGTVREDFAQKIEAKLGAVLYAGLVASQPQNAVAVSAQVVRTNNIFSTGQLQVIVSVQPYAYSPFVVATVGMTIQAS